MIAFKEHLAEFNSGSLPSTNLESWGSLTPTELTWNNGEKECVLGLVDVVGAAIAPNLPDLPDKFSGFVVSAYPIRRSGIFGKPRRKLREYRFICPDDRTRDRWIRAINNTLRGVADLEASLPPRHLHVILNPASGNQNPRQLFDRLSPIFAASQMRWTLTETQLGGDAIEIARNLSLDIDGLVVVGGDGTIYEVVNGLMSRPDWQQAIEIPIGIVPAGTGNGLSKTVLEMAGEPDDPVSAAFLIAKGEVRSFDLMRVKQGDRTYYSMLSLSWGLVSDVDIESERLRWLGSLRSDLYALLRILMLRTYRGRFSFVPPSRSSLDSDWQTIEDEFVFLWAMNLPWAARDKQAAPNVRADDGAMEVVVVRQGIAKWQLLAGLLQIADGSYLKIPGIDSYRAGKLQLEPLQHQGIFAVDGERVEYSTIEMEVLNGWIPVFCAS
ncbi:MAG: diacylglycerol kinase family protein [Cyanobacteriota bacterium]|nr:diacylglycerol kinase family protein [Cyanobacteriota bacterium]